MPRCFGEGFVFFSKNWRFHTNHIVKVHMKSLPHKILTISNKIGLRKQLLAINATSFTHKP